MASAVYIRSGKVKINFLDPSGKTYSEDIGSLGLIDNGSGENEMPDIANDTSAGGYGGPVRDDINTLCNNINSLVSSSLIEKIVTYEMEVADS